MGETVDQNNASVNGQAAQESGMTEQIAATAAEVLAKPQAQQSIAEIQTGNFSEEEQKQISDYAKTLDITDTKTIIEFGSGLQKQMADFSESVLDNVRTHDLGEVGDMLSGVISDLKDFDPDEKEKGGFFSNLFKKQGDKLTELKANYDKASDNIDKVAQTLQQHQIKLLKDVDMLDQMYASNLQYYKHLSMYIAAGKEKIADARENDLKAAKEKAMRTGLAEDAQAAKDLEDQIVRFEKKIYDLELTRAVALQTAPQIRMIQNNDTIMVEKIQSTIVNTIPLWKNQMVLTLGLNDSLQAAKAESDVTNMTNQLLMSNAEKLKQTTIESAKASERGIVDMETLKKTNESLIETLDEVARIQTEGRSARAKAEVELQQMEEQMKNRLLSLNSVAAGEPDVAVPAEPAFAPQVEIPKFEQPEKPVPTIDPANPFGFDELK